MIIKVTQRHIDAGQKNKCVLCPLALALYDTTKEVWGVRDLTYGRRFHLYYDKQLPKEAVLFVNRFDSGEKVEPCEFEMDVGF